VRLLAFSLLAVLAAGCGHFSARQRTLPERIQTIYIAMPENDSMEYGFQEDLARALHEEFLADGRVRVASREQADAWLETRIKTFSRTPIAFNSDDFPIVDRADMEAEITLWEPHDEKPLLRTTALGSSGFLSDPRRSQFSPETEWRASLLRDLSLRIVDAVLTYQPEDDERARFFGPSTEEPANNSNDVDLDRDFPQSVPSVGGYGLL
jgi:hypothetical protein